MKMLTRNGCYSFWPPRAQRDELIELVGASNQRPGSPERSRQAMKFWILQKSEELGHEGGPN